MSSKKLMVGDLDRGEYCVIKGTGNLYQVGRVLGDTKDHRLAWDKSGNRKELYCGNECVRLSRKEFIGDQPDKHYQLSGGVPCLAGD